MGGAKAHVCHASMGWRMAVCEGWRGGGVAGLSPPTCRHHCWSSDRPWCDCTGPGGHRWPVWALEQAGARDGGEGGQGPVGMGAPAIYNHPPNRRRYISLRNAGNLAPFFVLLLFLFPHLFS